MALRGGLHWKPLLESRDIMIGCLAVPLWAVGSPLEETLMEMAPDGDLDS
jgi:hypothetical protein